MLLIKITGKADYLDLNNKNTDLVINNVKIF